jgi:hypothetical protein
VGSIAEQLLSVLSDALVRWPIEVALLTAVAALVSMILALARILRALTSLIRSCVPLATAIHELRWAIIGRPAGANAAPSTQPSEQGTPGTASVFEKSSRSDGRAP